MNANSLWSWFKRWGLWLLLAITGLIYLLSRLLPSDGRKPELLQKAKDEAEKLKEGAADDLATHSEKMNERVKELDEIKAIEDEKERLKKLAEFANRR